MTLPDLLRSLVLALFGLTLGQTGWILRTYVGIVPNLRRLLPLHVVTISTGMLGLEAEAAWQNAVRFGEPFTWYIPINLALFSLVYAALLMVNRHVRRKTLGLNEIDSLVIDRDTMP